MISTAWNFERPLVVDYTRYENEMKCAASDIHAVSSNSDQKVLLEMKTYMVKLLFANVRVTCKEDLAGS